MQKEGGPDLLGQGCKPGQEVGVQGLLPVLYLQALKTFRGAALHLQLDERQCEQLALWSHRDEERTGGAGPAGLESPAIWLPPLPIVTPA